MSKERSYSINLTGLTVIFVILKLFGAIDWSWWWVLCPLWIPFAMIIVVLFIGLLFLIISLLFNMLSGK